MPAKVRQEYEELRRKIDEVTLGGVGDEWEEEDFLTRPDRRSLIY